MVLLCSPNTDFVLEYLGDAHYSGEHCILGVSEVIFLIAWDVVVTME